MLCLVTRPAAVCCAVLVRAVVPVLCRVPLCCAVQLCPGVVVRGQHSSASPPHNQLLNGQKGPVGKYSCLSNKGTLRARQFSIAGGGGVCVGGGGDAMTAQ